MTKTYNRYNEVIGIKKQVVERQEALVRNAEAKDAGDAFKTISKYLVSVDTVTEESPGFGTLIRELSRLVTIVEEGDALPSASIMSASQENLGSLDKIETQWQKIKTERLASVNSLLTKYQQAGLGVGTGH